MAAIVRYVDLNSTAGGDGTTNATTGANRAYASMSEWYTAEGTDLVTDGDTHECIITAGEYNEAWQVFGTDGWVAGASNTLTIRAATGDECTTSDFSDGVRFVTTTSATDQVLWFGAVDYTTIIGIGVKNSTTGLTAARAVYITNSSVTNRVMDRCIFQGSDYDTNCHGVYHLSDTGVVFRNCLAVNSGGKGFYIDNFDAAKFYNCAAIDNGSDGFYRFGTGGTRPQAYNCVAFGNGGSGFAGSYWSSLSKYNATDDSTAVGSNIVTDALTSGAFTNYASGDFTIASAASALYQSGFDFSSDYTTSLNGLTRSAPFDIGPYAYASAAGAGIRNPLGGPLALRNPMGRM